MSLERIFKALMALGLSEREVPVYFYIATKGPALARNIISNLPIKKRMAYRILKNLQVKGIVIVSKNNPTEYFALPFEEVLSMLIEQRNKQAKLIKEKKEELIHNWKEQGK